MHARPQVHGNLTGFPELYSKGHLIIKFFSCFFLFSLPAVCNNSEHEKSLSISMGLNGFDCIRKIEVLKLNNVQIRWDQMIQIEKPVNSNVSVARINRIKKEYWIKFQFGHFIIHLKRRLLTSMMKSILQLPTSNLGKLELVSLQVSSFK